MSTVEGSAMLVEGRKDGRRKGREGPWSRQLVQDRSLLRGKMQVNFYRSFFSVFYNPSSIRVTTYIPHSTRCLDSEFCSVENMAVPAWCVVADQRRRKCHKRRELKSGKEMKIDGDLEKKSSSFSLQRIERERRENQQ